ncbi:MAG: dual specificity protein phosphatase family protein [Desulfobacterales bacterium]|nr:dual specificity protein phosphatase family protein [Desulfobacterales bacterium]
MEKGRLYRSGKLSQKGFETVCKRFGIKTVVNLTDKRNFEGKQWLVGHKEYCEKNGIKHIQIPMLTNEMPTEQQVRKFVDICDKSESYPVLVHCMQGVLRTGIMVAVYLKNYQDMDNQAIFEKLPPFGHDFKSERYVIFRNFVLNYKNDGME